MVSISPGPKVVCGSAGVGGWWSRPREVIFVGQSLSNFLRYSRHSLRKDQWATRVACVTLSCDSVISQLNQALSKFFDFFLPLVREWGPPPSDDDNFLELYVQ